MKVKIYFLFFFIVFNSQSHFSVKISLKAIWGERGILQNIQLCQIIFCSDSMVISKSNLTSCSRWYSIFINPNSIFLSLNLSSNPVDLHFNFSFFITWLGNFELLSTPKCLENMTLKLNNILRIKKGLGNWWELVFLLEDEKQRSQFETGLNRKLTFKVGLQSLSRNIFIYISRIMTETSINEHQANMSIDSRQFYGFVLTSLRKSFAKSKSHWETVKRKTLRRAKSVIAIWCEGRSTSLSSRIERTSQNL